MKPGLQQTHGPARFDRSAATISKYRLSWIVSMAVALGAGSALAKPDAALNIEAVSNRADLVSGGDVLLRVTLPRKHHSMRSSH